MLENIAPVGTLIEPENEIVHYENVDPEKNTENVDPFQTKTKFSVSFSSKSMHFCEIPRNFHYHLSKMGEFREMLKKCAIFEKKPVQRIRKISKFMSDLGMIM